MAGGITPKTAKGRDQFQQRQATSNWRNGVVRLISLCGATVEQNHPWQRDNNKVIHTTPDSPGLKHHDYHACCVGLPYRETVCSDHHATLCTTRSWVFNLHSFMTSHRVTPLMARPVEDSIPGPSHMRPGHQKRQRSSKMGRSSTSTDIPTR